MALIFLFVRLWGHRSSLIVTYWRINKRWTKVYFFAADWTNCILCAGCPWQTMGITKKSPSLRGCPWQTVGITKKSSSLLPRPSLLERGGTEKDCTGCPWQTVGITQKSSSLQGSPWQTVGYSRWASEARSVSSNPRRN